MLESLLARLQKLNQKTINNLKEDMWLHVPFLFMSILIFNNFLKKYKFYFILITKDYYFGL